MTGTSLTLEERAARRKAIAEDIRTGLSIDQAAVKYGICRSSAYNACLEYNVDLKNRNPNTARVCRILFELLYTTETLRDIADGHEVSVSHVSKTLNHARNAGFKFPMRQDRKGRERK